MYGYPILFLTMGFGFWFIGEFLWVVYEFIVHIDPYPSAADYFYLLAYPFFISAFILAIRSGGVQLTGFNRILFFLFGLNAIWITGIVLYFGVYLAYDPAVTLLENVVAMSYGVGDLMIFLSCLLSLVLAWEYREGKILNTWMYLFAGFMLTLLADIAFSINHVQYEAGAVTIRNVLDCLWILGYLYFAFGMFEFAYIIREIQKRLKG
jgi:hypothetical protein